MRLSRLGASLGAALVTLACLATACGSPQGENVGSGSEAIGPYTYYTCADACTDEAHESSVQACAQTSGCAWTATGAACVDTLNCSFLTDQKSCMDYLPDAGLAQKGPCTWSDGACVIATPCPTGPGTTREQCWSTPECYWTAGASPCQMEPAVTCPTGDYYTPTRCTSVSPACEAVTHTVGGGSSGSSGSSSGVCDTRCGKVCC